MNVYGDRGNIIALDRRCRWRGIDLHVTSVGRGDRFPPDADLLFFGGGQDREQAAIADDFVQHKGAAVREFVETDGVALAVCGGFQLLGASYTTVDGQELPGAGVFDARTEPGRERWIGNVVVETDHFGTPRTLVGFENHSGRTLLSSGCAPLGRVIVGKGNNGTDGTEGAVYRSAFGCYLHGSLLPKNPWFADELLGLALRRRYGPDARLEPLDDSLEERAHASVRTRAQRLHKRRSGAW
jgi:hypothetical protein